MAQLDFPDRYKARDGEVEEALLLKVTNLVKDFNGRKSVDGVSFSVAAGEVFGLLGPNGAGKSTTIAMICGLLSPDQGEISFAGQEAGSGANAVRQSIGLVPQDIALYPTLSARENLNFWGRMYGLGGKVLRERVNGALEIADLADRANERIETYSGGMKRRINIAASLLHRPKLLIMDEPTVGIDPQSRNHILETVRLLNNQGMAVIYTSHYMEEVESVCSRVAIMDQGKVLAQGSLKELAQIAGGLDVVTVEAPSIGQDVQDCITAIPGVSGVTASSGQVQFLSTRGSEALPEVMACFARLGLKVGGVKVKEPNLETVFLQLTGRTLRD